MKERVISAASGIAVLAFCIWVITEPSAETVRRRTEEQRAAFEKEDRERAQAAALYAQQIKEIDLRIEREDRQKRRLEEGRRNLEEWDAAIRNNNTDRLKELESNSVHHTMSNSHGVRIDRFRLKDGSTVVCTTAVTGPGPAQLNCT